MSNDFDSLLDELHADGHLDDDVAERLRKASEGSPLRAQLKEEKARADRFRDHATKAAFKEAGIKIDPSVLNLPDDLDVTDAEKFREWAEGRGLVEPAPPSEEEQKAEAVVETQERIAKATAGGSTATAPGVITPADAAKWPVDRWARFEEQHPDQAESLLRGEEVVGVS